MTGKVTTGERAAGLIGTGQTIATSGFVGIGVPEHLLATLEQHFLTTGAPRDLTLVFAAGQGDGKERGLNHLGHEGLLKRVIGGHWGLIPKVGKLALDNKIEAWNLPQGVVSQLYREIAAGRSGLLTTIGLGTFVDPRLDGGRVNAISTEDIVTLTDFGGREQLFYKAFPIDVALIRASTADEAGNLSMEREALVLDNLAMAMAARNSGGIVIAQVERIAAEGSLPPKEVIVPGVLVDAVVVAPEHAHPQTFATQYSPYYAGLTKAPPAREAPEPLTPRKIIARRAAMELPPGGVVNLGIGMPEGVAAVAEEEGVLNAVTLTAEPGVLGGRPASGLDFGAAVNTDSIIPQNAQFDFYDGGGLDLACLGMAEADRAGNINVSRFGPRLAGAGGFINISQSARAVVFCGTFTAGGLDMDIASDRLSITREGRNPKFVDEVEQVTFSGALAQAKGTPVLYVTERAVFRLTAAGVELIEIAPGIDLDHDVLSYMGFTPIMGTDIPLMDTCLFQTDRMGLDGMLFAFDARARVTLAGGRLMLDFTGLHIRTEADIAAIDRGVRAALAGQADRVPVLVDYTGFDIAPGQETAYAAMVARLEDNHYTRAALVAPSPILHLKLTQIFAHRPGLSLFDTPAAAKAHLAAAG